MLLELGPFISKLNLRLESTAVSGVIVNVTSNGTVYSGSTDQTGLVRIEIPNVETLTREEVLYPVGSYDPDRPAYEHRYTAPFTGRVVSTNNASPILLS